MYSVAKRHATTDQQRLAAAVARREARAKSEALLADADRAAHRAAAAERWYRRVERIYREREQGG